MKQEREVKTRHHSNRRDDVRGRPNQLYGAKIFAFVALMISGAGFVAGCRPPDDMDRVVAANGAFSLVPPDGWHVREPALNGEYPAGTVVLELQDSSERDSALIVAVSAEPLGDRDHKAFEAQTWQRVTARMTDIVAPDPDQRREAGLSWRWRRIQYREMRDREPLQANGSDVPAVTLHDERSDDPDDRTGRLPLREAWFGTAVDERHGYLVVGEAPAGAGRPLDSAVMAILTSLRR